MWVECAAMHAAKPDEIVVLFQTIYLNLNYCLRQLRCHVLVTAYFKAVRIFILSSLYDWRDVVVVRTSALQLVYPQFISVAESYQTALKNGIDSFLV